MSEPKTRIKLVHKLIAPAAAIASLCGLIGCELESIKSGGDAHSTDVNWDKIKSCCDSCKISGYECTFNKDYCTCEIGIDCHIKPYLCDSFEKCQKNSFTSTYHCVPLF